MHSELTSRIISRWLSLQQLKAGMLSILLIIYSVGQTAVWTSLLGMFILLLAAQFSKCWNVIVFGLCNV